jgi:hypothetical protein
LAQARVDILGRSLADLRPWAREAAVVAAREYLHQAGEPLPDTDPSSLLLAGHQPELFHPGVWVKHFALNGLAHRHQATPLNLVVDNDIVKTTGLRLPDLHGLSNSGPEVVTAHVEPFDRWDGEFPYEERQVLDEQLFASLPERAAAFLKGWDADLLLPAFWKEAQRQASRTPLLGERIAAARRALERSWGCHNLEVPVSRLCQTEPFAWFACHLLAHLPRFHEIHNACLREYRSLHGLRSRSHPVPDLSADGDWLEVPLWAWRSERPQRGRLRARATAAGVELRVGGDRWPTLPLSGTGDPRKAVAGWLDLKRQGFKVRSRALTNTLYARLFLGDLFIHGIGGAKYDELTDEIIRRFYEFEPPGYMVLSATLRLPLPALPVRGDEHRRLAHYLHDLRCNPQRHLSNGHVSDPRAVALANEKQEWIARQPQTARGRQERFRILKQLTTHLRPYLTDRESRTEHELREGERKLQINALLQRRDYAFCLFPESVVRPFCTQFLRSIV